MFREASFQALVNVRRSACPNKYVSPKPMIHRWLWTVLSICSLAIVSLFVPSNLIAQTTATLSGTVEDPSGGVIPNATVTLTDVTTKATRVVTTNAVGLYAFPSLVPGTYDIKATAKGFEAKVVTGIVLNAGDIKTVPALALAIGSEALTVTVSAASEMIPVENGAHTDVLSSKDIDTLALEGRDTTELLRVLPGTVTTSGGLTQTAPAFNDLTVTVDQSAVGNGLYTNGSIYRGGESILVDGAETIDVGNMASSLVIIPPAMTAQVSVQSSNMSADQPFGPVVVSTISKSGSANYHGEAYFDARNNVLNANGWQQKNAGTAQGPASWYYPGGNIGGPVPGTHKHLLFWGGYERWLQNLGNSQVATSFIPTPAMMAGDFSMDDPANAKLCPDGFFQGKPPGGYPGGAWCSDLGGTVLANGTTTTTLPAVTTGPTGSGAPTTVMVGGKPYTADYGQKFPSAAYLDPGAAALAKIWPAANVNPTSSVCQGCNFYFPVTNVQNGWIYRVRLDYQWGANTKIYGSYEQAFSSSLAGSGPQIGAHLYWTPGNSIPFPGGAEVESNHGKVATGHIVHNFNSTTTNDFLAAWAYGSYPFVAPDLAAASRVKLGYPYGKVFGGVTPGELIPAYTSAGAETFPDFSQPSIFDNPPGQYAVKKEAPQFADTLTKVWGAHTVRLGGFEQTTDNFQSSFSYFLDGRLSFSAAQNNDAANGVFEGSPFNPVAQFFNGVGSSYQENNAAPIGDVAELNLAGFADDTWKTTKRLTLELGIRVEHVGHWYDRQKTGLAVFYPNRVLTDYIQGKYAPGYYWHAIDAGVPLSGQPNRFAYPDARFGMSYDVFGTGNTVVRGGWGVYRYLTQVNTVANGAAQGTAAHVLQFNTTSGTDIQLQNITSLPYTACPNPLASPVPGKTAPPCGVQGGQTGLDASNYGQPMTQAYNFTIDQKLKWNTQLEVAYVGSQSSQLVNNGEDIEGSAFNEIANVNKMPIGALFSPDPVTGHLATNPEHVQCDPNFTTGTCTSFGTNISGTAGNSYADYHPLGYAYGSNSTYVEENTAYANYNSLQLSWIKTTGRLTFDFNGTWSKMLGTTLQEDPYSERGNYAPTAEDRPFVFSSTYTYSSGALHMGNDVVNKIASGWTINGISTWQAGGYFPALLGNGVPNFGLGIQYTDLPPNAAAADVSTSVSSRTYFGTDEGALSNGNVGLNILPVLTCNPKSGLANTSGNPGTNQVLNGKCFSAPGLNPVDNPTAGVYAVSGNGGFHYPYMRTTAFFDNDLALYRTFHVHEHQNFQLRASAFDWLNHSLWTFAGSNNYTLNYNLDYATKALTPTFNQGNTGANAFGVMTVRSALPYARIIELDATYSF